MENRMKSGYLLRYRKHIFCKEWRREYLVLFKDSRLLWYKEKEKSTPEGGLIVRESPGLIAIGVYTARVPNRPDIPPGFGLNQLIALGTKDRHKVYWFLSKSEEDASHWLAAICETLPPPPRLSNSRLANEYYSSKETDSTIDFASSSDCNDQNEQKMEMKGGNHTAKAFATGVLIGGAMACALGWGNGVGWGIGGSYDYDFDDIRTDVYLANDDNHYGDQQYGDHDATSYDCGDMGGYDGADAGCDFAAIF